MLLLFIKTSLINTILFKINPYICEVFSFSYLLFAFSPVKRREKKNLLERKHEIICFMFRNNFFHKNSVRESGTSSLLQKERYGSAKSDVSKVLISDIGKITNQFSNQRQTHLESSLTSKMELFCENS